MVIGSKFSGLYFFTKKYDSDTSYTVYPFPRWNPGKYAKPAVPGCFKST